MKSVKLFIIWLLFLSHAGLSQADSDWEFWPGNTVKIKLNDRMGLKFIEEFRIHNDMSDFYTYVLYAGSYFKLNKYIDTAIWYKFVESKKHNHWEDSHRYDLDGILKYDLGVFKLSNRSRFEHNLTAESWLYRDRIKLAKEFELFDKKYTPYIFNEFFIDMSSDDGYKENRAQIGFLTDFFFKTKLTLYYMSRAKKSDNDWKNADVLGASLGMSF